MKLQLKHLAGYLPYGLKFLSNKHRFKFGEQTSLISRGMSLCDEGSLNIEFLYEDNLVFSNEMKFCIPLLRPLSDLTKEIEVNGKKFVPILELSGYKDLKGETFKGYEHKMYYLKIRLESTNEWLIHTIPSDVNSMNYFTIQKLYEWHFDIHGLIEKELAIDMSWERKQE